MTGFKKRLASTALATAMTLTALPVSVFFISTGAAAEGVPSGFAYAQGTRFMLDGSPFYYAGTNCYYLTFKSQEAVDNVFKDAEAMGLKVIRVWGNFVKVEQRIPVRISLKGNKPEDLKRLRAGFNIECEVKY